VVTTALGEEVDVDAVALSDSLVTVTPSEYGMKSAVYGGNSIS
jgi:hypothetical protein